jgi:hypothetical protein
MESETNVLQFPQMSSLVLFDFKRHWTNIPNWNTLTIWHQDIHRFSFRANTSENF